MQLPESHPFPKSDIPKAKRFVRLKSGRVLAVVRTIGRGSAELEDGTLVHVEKAGARWLADKDASLPAQSIPGKTRRWWRLTDYRIRFVVVYLVCFSLLYLELKLWDGLTVIIPVLLALWVLGTESEYEKRQSFAQEEETVDAGFQE